MVVPYNCAAWVTKYSMKLQKLNYRLIFNQHLNIKAEKAFTPKTKQAKLTQKEEEKATCGHNHPKRKKSGDEEEFEYYEDPDMDKYITSEEKDSLENVVTFEKFLKEKIGITAFKTVDVKHCPQAFGVMIEHQSGWRYIYSGDTRPYQKMVDEIGKATIVVHEATFSHELQETAIAKNHSTDREAIEIGMKLGAWRTVLTHFSQRYAVIKSLWKSRK